MKTERVKRVLASAPLVLDLIRRVCKEFDDRTSLPADARAVAVYIDAERNAFTFIVESESFEPIAECEVIPLLEVTVKQ